MLADLQNFLEQPFQSNMSAQRWFMFFGLLLIISAFWHMIIRAFVNAT